MKTITIISLLFFITLFATLTVSATWVHNQSISIPPSNEGYIAYNSAGGGTYTLHSPWTDAITELLTYNTPGTNGRTFFEFNWSHYLPIDTNVTMMNLTYSSTTVGGTAGTVGGVWVFLHPTTMGTYFTNSSTPTNIWNAITTGPAITDSTVMSTWFTSPQEWLNRSTDPPALTVMDEGYWLTDFEYAPLGMIRNIRNSTMDNLTNSRDNMVIGLYIATGAASASGGMNTSQCTENWFAKRPTFNINASFNRSMSNWTNFTNSSQYPMGTTVHFKVNNSNGTSITYFVMLQDVSTGIWTEQKFVRRTANATISVKLTGANQPDHEYRWYYQVVNGSLTPYTIFNFSTETPTINPPSNILITDFNSTTLNITFTPFSYAGGYTKTVCYYTTGTIAPVYGAGTLGGNTSTSYMNITHLAKGTTYTFSFWSYWNDTANTSWSALSSWYENRTNTTGYGEVVVCLRYENITTSNTNMLVNLSNRSIQNSTHRLIVHYANASASITEFSSTTYNSYGYTPNITVTLTQYPIFYEFIYNYSTNSTLNYSCQYTRLLTPLAETTNTSGETLLTFYLTTNKLVYNQYYLFTPYGGSSYYNLSDDITGLVDYSYILDDQSGYFTPTNTYSTIASVFTYVGQNKLIIDQRYVDASAKINPTLLYHSYYYIALNSTTTPDINYYYSNLGLVPTERVTSPYTETIVIYPLSIDTASIFKNVTYSFGWTATGLWVHFQDTSLSTSKLMFTIYNVTNNSNQWLTTFWVNGTSDYNYSYTSTNPWHDNITYKISVNLSYTFSNGITKDFTMDSIYIFMPSLYHIIQAATINGICTLILGASPFYNPDTGQTIPYADAIIFFFGIFLLLGFAGVGQPVLGAGAMGITYLVSSYIISGLGTGFIILGIFMLVLAILQSIKQGGRE